MRRDAAIRVQAAICSRFGVAWHMYGSLTLREVRVLLGVIAQENDGDKAPSGPVDRTTSTAPAGKVGANGERLERVC